MLLIFTPADINECASSNANNCDVRANCTNTEGSFSCSCMSGYSGAGTTATCMDIDECALDIDSCDIHADCNNTEGSYECNCQAGFTGSGEICGKDGYSFGELHPKM